MVGLTTRDGKWVTNIEYALGEESYLLLRLSLHDSRILAAFSPAGGCMAWHGMTDDTHLSS